MNPEEGRNGQSGVQYPAFFFEHLPGMAFIKKPQGRYVFAAGSSRDLLPHPCQAIIGKSDREVWPADLVARLKEADARVCRSNAPMQTIETLASGTGRSNWLIYKFPITTALGRLIGGIVLRYHRAVKESERQPIDLTERLIAALDNERKRLAFRLHDELGHDLLLLKLRLASLGDRIMETGAGFLEEYASLLRFTDGVIENFRRVSHDLSPAMLEKLGLSSSLEYLLDEHCTLHNVQHRISNMEAIDLLFTLQSQTHIYRIFQEVLTNIARHARATNVSVDIQREEDRVTFSIEDNGVGFHPGPDAASPAVAHGLGLTAIQERIRLLAGVFTIESSPGRGTRIRFSIPIDDRSWTR